ncbi:helix-turn-helix domain-containing protein [Bradyrhizobium sp. CCBAU 051011]|uniref:helix-turn-helix domain-containing protein n=1 Tax=Bradyrhizobium sp. CCBAU 051011 TaxID=858422 RepID=UPI00137AAA85|nr:helix-turn-helix domain-containing protein [Bradyrhizobium sp. CCBAU 051011]
MSILDPSPPPFAIPSDEQVEAFVRKIAQAVADQLGADTLNSPFIRSTECAQILGITPEHLCAMRARKEGPPWCGEGKWVRYERAAVHEWLRNLPRHSTPVSPAEPKSNRSCVTDLRALRRCDHE